MVHRELHIDASPRDISLLLRQLTFQYTSSLHLAVNLDNDSSAETPVLASLEAHLDDWVIMLRSLFDVSHFTVTDEEGHEIGFDWCLFLGSDLRKAGNGFSLFMHFDGVLHEAAPMPAAIVIIFEWKTSSRTRPVAELPTIVDVTRITLALLSALPDVMFEDNGHLDLFFKFSSPRGHWDEGWLDSLGVAWEGLASLFPNIKCINAHDDIAREFLRCLCQSHPWRFFPLLREIELGRLRADDIDLLKKAQTRRRSLYITATHTKAPFD